jgi:hypothetical protein
VVVVVMVGLSVEHIAAHTAPDLPARYARRYSADTAVVRDYLD